MLDFFTIVDGQNGSISTVNSTAVSRSRKEEEAATVRRTAAGRSPNPRRQMTVVAGRARLRGAVAGRARLRGAVARRAEVQMALGDEWSWCGGAGVEKWSMD